MKKLLIIAMLATSLSSFAQYSNYAPPKGWKSPELYLPATILVSTYMSVSEIPNTTYGERTTMAATGIATSIITHFVFRKIREKHNYKTFNRKLICKR
ncbi:hypothetical protein RPMD05_89 [Rhodobacteraceae phage LS06-2018-MD05]|nr:hypothetical protein RPMD05_89 [Rhodobacteraceae phage LS06-2018-MD05]